MSVRDCTRLFSREVVEPFVRSYAQGLTPSPCVGCNARAKVPALLQAAGEAGCARVATGHYARIAQVLPPGDAGAEDAAPAGADAPADGAPPRDGMGGAVAAPGAPADVVGAAPAAAAAGGAPCRADGARRAQGPKLHAGAAFAGAACAAGASPGGHDQGRSARDGGRLGAGGGGKARQPGHLLHRGRLPPVSAGARRAGRAGPHR